MTGFYKIFEEGKTHIQLGNNDNLFDWTCVQNVAYAHLLAADRLSTPPPAGPVDYEKYVTTFDYPELTEEELDIVSKPLPPIEATSGSYRIPSSEARPLGPYVDYPPNGDKILAAFQSSEVTALEPVNRTRFDPLSTHALSRQKLHAPHVNPLQVAGQAFFITNGEPIYFWDLARMVWHELDTHFPGHRKPRKPLVLPRSVGMLAAYGAEWAGWLTGKEPTFTRYKVTYTCVNRWHNIEKARRVLGYGPKVGLQEGVKSMVDVSC